MTTTTAAPNTAPAAALNGAGSTAMLTDRYELTMLRAAIADGTVNHRAVFELFARRLPKGRRYGVWAGLDRIIDAVERFRFTPEHIDFLLRRGVVDDATAAYLADFRFTGSIDAYREGELYFGYSPVLTVEGTFGEGCILETVLLSIANHDSAIAGAAARMVTAARGRTLIEMGSRRTSESAAVAAARAAYLVGFDVTSNLEAGFVYDVPTAGTSAHAFTLLHGDERAAFTSQVAALGNGTTLLVDTFDTETGIANAIELGGPDLGGVRIDSGDPEFESRRARKLLDEAGNTRTRVVLTGDLDEYKIAELADAPVDAYGVGTKLVTGSGAPTAEMVYKLVARADEPGLDAPLRPVAKRSAGKASIGGRKRAYRRIEGGKAVAEIVTARALIEDVAGDTTPGRPLQVPVIVNGQTVHRPTLEEIRSHHRAAMVELVDTDLDLTPGTPRLTGEPTTAPSQGGA